MRTCSLLVAAAASLLSVSAVAQVGNNLGLTDPNLAAREELLELPGVNSAVADAIIGARPVLNMLDLDKALTPLLSREQLETLYGHLFRQINLNAASRDEIMLIPQMTCWISSTQTCGAWTRMLSFSPKIHHKVS